MSNLKKTKCPLCNSSQIAPVFNLDCGNLTPSDLYPSIHLVSCNYCGHLFNALTEADIIGLDSYYNKEYSVVNINSPSKGDMPGSNSKNTLKRYSNILKILKNNLTKESVILDIGCALGGFLDFLKDRKFMNLYGIDLSEIYIQEVVKKGYDTRYGLAEAIPHSNNFFDCLVMDQVIEHSFEPRKVFKEAKRVLKKGGYFCIGLPNAEEYSKSFVEFYWFLMREHIQHFSLDHLVSLAESEGFVLVDAVKNKVPTINHKVLLPNLTALFQLVGRKSNSKVSKSPGTLLLKTQEYLLIEGRSFDNRVAKLNKLAALNKTVFAFGIGREFLLFYANSNIKKTNLVLIDNNTIKQQEFKVHNLKIQNKNILKTASKDSILIVTALAHYKQLCGEVKSLGYKGSIVKL